MRRPYLIGIVGGSGSGKTWLARRLADALQGQSEIISVDWYYRDLSALPPEVAAQANFDHPDAIESELLASHLRSLLDGQTVAAPDYDFSRHARLAEARTIEPRPLLILEGLFALSYPPIAALLDDSVYVDVPEPIRLDRRLARDQSERGYTRPRILEMWRAHALPMHREHVEPSRAIARRVWSPASDPAFPALLSDELRDRIRPPSER